jgi:hypothetical protein
VRVIALASARRTGQYALVRRPVVWFSLAAALLGWTFLMVSCAGVVTMSAADSPKGDAFPTAAVVVLIVLGVLWIAIPVIVWMTHRRSRRSVP